MGKASIPFAFELFFLILPCHPPEAHLGKRAGDRHIRKDVELTFYLRPLELRNFRIYRMVRQCSAFMFRI